MERCGVRRRAADDDGDVELVDELLQVERLDVLADVLGADRGAPDDEQVDAGVDDGLVVLLRALRTEGARHRHPGRADLGDALRDQLRLDRLGVERLHALRGIFRVEAADLGEHRLRVCVTGPDALEVEDAQAAEAADRDRDRGADHGIHGRREHRDVEGERVDRPADADILRIAGAPAGDDRDVVERECPARALGPPDLDVAHRSTLAISVPGRRVPRPRPAAAPRSLGRRTGTPGTGRRSARTIGRG